MENKKTNFANGYDYFCTNCNVFFLIQCSVSGIGDLEHCPYCGDKILSSVKELAAYCEDNEIDTINFYNAFPRYEPIPGSRAGATPLEVSIIIDLVALRRHRDLPITVEDIAGQCEPSIDIVRKVFEELGITETGGLE